MAKWKIPGGTSYGLYAHILNGSHALIAGKTGSGKSVLLNGLICEILQTRYPLNCADSANSCGLILIDPKRVEFANYKRLPHVIQYANTETEAVEALKYANSEMDNRFIQLEKSGKKKITGSALYVIIDEYADISGNKEVCKLVDRIARLGRAANIHLIIATQRPAISDKTITAATRANLDCRIALKTAEAKDSRLIIGDSCAFDLPKYGYCYYLAPEVDSPTRVKVPNVPDERITELVKFWVSQCGFLARLTA